MNKTIVGIFTLGFGTLWINAMNSEDTGVTQSIRPSQTLYSYHEVKSEKSIEVAKKSTQKSQPKKPKLTPVTSSNCDPNYSPCVPIASDVDCAGGKGNGPAYVRGPVQVIGRDIYDLDRDGNGWGCE